MILFLLILICIGFFSLTFSIISFLDENFTGGAIGVIAFVLCMIGVYFLASNQIKRENPKEEKKEKTIVINPSEYSISKEIYKTERNDTIFIDTVYVFNKKNKIEWIKKDLMNFPQNFYRLMTKRNWLLSK